MASWGERTARALHLHVHEKYRGREHSKPGTNFQAASYRAAFFYASLQRQCQ